MTPFLIFLSKHGDGDGDGDGDGGQQSDLFASSTDSCSCCTVEGSHVLLVISFRILRVVADHWQS